MSFTAILLASSIGLLAVFGAYWLALHVFVLIHAFAPLGALPTVRREGRGSVLVLVPSHHEGESLADTVRSLVEQDYEGELAVEVLVADFTDSSVQALQAAFECLEETADRQILDPRRSQRRVTVVAVGASAKPAKLNHALRRASADFIALLDADHRAHLSWISTAISVLETGDAAGVQSRKRPLSTSRLAQIWDASLSHVAFELFNRASQRSFDSVSFTGSTAVFRGEVLANQRFSSCITEDTYLSFGLLLQGHRIVYDRRVGSYEEATPTIPSFVFRRRRWAAGHTHAFFAQLLPFLRSKASLGRKLQVFLLGQFFLVPIAITLFFSAQGLYYLALFTVEVRAAVLGVSGLLALGLTLWLSWRRSTKVNDLIVCWAVLLPHVAMSGALFYLAFAEETFYFITSFPYQGQLWAAQGLLIGAGLLVYGVAWWFLRSLGAWQALVFTVTVPLVIFFDLLSALLGFSDLLMRRRVWTRIDRRHEVSEAVDPALRAQLQQSSRQTRSRWAHALWATPVLLLAVVVTNDALSIGPCGDRVSLLWDPILFSPPDQPVLSVRLEKEVEGDRVRVKVRSRIQPREPGPLSLRIFEDREQVTEDRVEPSADGVHHDFELDWPLGWETRRIGVSLSGRGQQCWVEREVPTNVVELEREGMRVNGEPFLIKGIVPTFSAPGIRMEVEEGYAQLKAAGVNAARLYHPPTEAILESARRHHMLLIPQPERSTWDSLDPESPFDQVLYERRWRSLVDDTEGEPFVLMLNTGNELEIDDRRPEMLAAIQRLLANADATKRGGLTTYSSFATYVDYPVDVLGINMLDTGPTYWEQALHLVEEMGHPFYASEFGGFVAFFESPSAELRQWRMWRQSEALQRRGALGAVFFASHDNWSQAVPPGNYNDPFSDSHPDDSRGFWDPANRPKPELTMLRYLLSDLGAEVVDEIVGPGLERVRIRVTNRRAYALETIELSLGGDASWAVGALAPGAATELTLPLEALRQADGYPEVDLHFAYRSHRGLEGQSRWRMAVPDPARGPVLLGAPLFGLFRSGETLACTVLLAGEAELVVPPEWSAVSFGGVTLPNPGGRIPVVLPGPDQPVEDLEMSSDGRRWRAFDGRNIGTGDRFLRFRLPRVPAASRTLVLAGLAATRVYLRWSDGLTNHSAHPYRETAIDVSDRSGLVTLRMKRSRARYLSARQSPTGEAVLIELARPFVFAPHRIEVTRGAL